MTKSTPTLTQSGMLAVLLQYQRYKVFQVARRRAHRKQMRADFWSILTWPYRALTAPKVLDDSIEPFVGAVPYLHRAAATDSRRPADPTSRMGRAKWRMPQVRFLRVVPQGIAQHFDAKGIQRVYRCYSSRPRTAV